jgi:methylmalonyl-CoA/ethylmalonyl-CoA epimerase
LIPDAARSVDSVPMLPLNIHHTAIAVEDLDAAIADFAAQYGVSPSYREVVEDQGVEEAMIPLGGSHVQLLRPLGPDTPVGRFLASRGEGLHHIAFQVADIDAALAHLDETGVRLVDRVARPGGGGHRIAFVHPSAVGSTLIELVEVV